MRRVALFIDVKGWFLCHIEPDILDVLECQLFLSKHNGFYLEAGMGCWLVRSKISWRNLGPEMIRNVDKNQNDG